MTDTCESKIKELIAEVDANIQHNEKRVKYFGHTNNIMELTAQANASSAVNMLSGMKQSLQDLLTAYQQEKMNISKPIGSAERAITTMIEEGRRMEEQYMKEGNAMMVTSYSSSIDTALACLHLIQQDRAAHDKKRVVEVKTDFSGEITEVGDVICFTCKKVVGKEDYVYDQKENDICHLSCWRAALVKKVEDLRRTNETISNEMKYSQEDRIVAACRTGAFKAVVDILQSKEQ
jgi:hypothetical protein